MSCSRLGLLAAFVFFTGCAAPAPATSAVTPASASASTSLPRVDAQTALSAARPGLRACRRNIHATPVVFEATLEFEPSGKVGRVLIEPAGPVADCVRSDLAQVEIPKFDGPPMEVEMQLTL
jgi:hypothetical protein